MERFAERLAEGAARFNRAHFFEAHDLWEDLWTETRGPERAFLEGLIHAAVGCYHLEARNFEGARSQLGLCRDALAPFAPVHRGLDLAALLRRVEDYLDRLSGPGPPRLQGIRPPRLSSAPDCGAGTPC